MAATLFTRTGLTLAMALAVLLAVTLGAGAYYVLIPIGQGAADDLAAVMILAGQRWIERSPDEGDSLTQEVERQYGLRIGAPDGALIPIDPTLPYLRFLQRSLAARIGRGPTMGTDPERPNWYWVDLTLATTPVRIGFHQRRIGARPPPAIAWVVGAGTLVVLATSLVQVRKLTRPLERLSRAASEMGRGRFHPTLPERGPAELAALERSFNRMAAQLRQLLANRTTLMAGISHDLRTPLARMQVTAELLEGTVDRDLLQGLLCDIELMKELTRDALAFARGLGEEPQDAVEVRALIDGLVGEFRDGAVLVHGATWCPGTAAPLALRRVLRNLLDNAVRFSEGEPVDVELRCGANGAIVRILDRGPGVPATEREAVFEPFYRLDASRNSETGGSGLGLAIARQLCDSHGWRVALLHRSGGGTEARLSMPARAESNGRPG